jgi:flagellar hook-associated protein 2
MSSTTAPLFSVGGLASGLDTASIVTGLTNIQAAPLNALLAQQTGYKTQVSLLGQLVSKINTLQTAAAALSTNGAIGVKTTSVNTDFTATPSSQTVAGSHDVSVQALASSAQQRSTAFASNSASVTGGTLDVNVEGVDYGTVNISDGEALSDVAADIRGLGAPINAAVVNDGTHAFLQVTNLNTGFTGASSSSALQLTESYTGTQGQQLGLATTHPATNSLFTIDGLQFTRQSNTVTDAIDGTTLALKGQSNTDESLTMDYDSATTASNMQAFVDAYNDIVTTVQKQLSGGGSTDRNSTLTGDSALRSLMTSMQSLTSAVVTGGGTVRTLADIGFKTNFQDGTISIDPTKLASAIASNAGSVNNIFSQAQSGLGDLTLGLATTYTDVVDGVFTSQTKNLNSSITQMTQQASDMQARLDAYKANLNAQFDAMEQIVSGLKATGTFLTQQSASQAAAG